MTLSKEARELEDYMEGYISFMKRYGCVSTLRCRDDLCMKGEVKNVLSHGVFLY